MEWFTGYCYYNCPRLRWKRERSYSSHSCSQCNLQDIHICPSHDHRPRPLDRCISAHSSSRTIQMRRLHTHTHTDRGRESRCIADWAPMWTFQCVMETEYSNLCDDMWITAISAYKLLTINHRNHLHLTNYSQIKHSARHRKRKTDRCVFFVWVFVYKNL